MGYKLVKNCRCCKSENLIKFLDLNEQPLANSYHDGKQKQNQYPLALNLCKDCFHCQLSIVVDPAEMFENYLYLSSTSEELNKYFVWFAEMVQDDLKRKGCVLDIACNDGTQLEKFKKNGWITHGIDPAKNLLQISSKKSDMIVNDYFEERSIKKLGNITYDAIVAQNVFAHVDNIYKFLELCKNCLKDDGKIYIQTSQANMIEDCQFDTVYHEHLSFFSTKSMLAICKRVGLFLESVKIVPIHGGSYLFTISKNNKCDNSVKERLDFESTAGRYKIDTYYKYKNNINHIIKEFKEIVNDYKRKGYIIVGYGAAAKGNTFLNHSKVKLHYIIDDNDKKQKLLTPGSNTLIVGSEFIENFANNVLFVPLAWNFYQEIKQKIVKQVNNLKFKNYFKYKIYSYYPKPFIEDIR